MRKLVLVLILFFILLFTLPLLMLKGCENSESGSDYEDNLTSESNLTIRVFRTDLDKIVEMDLEEYVLGVLAGEMPASFHLEALKAQALAARTYTIMRMQVFGGKGCLNHPGADICTDSTHCQAFVNTSTLGSSNLKKLKQAVMDTKGEVIVYQDKLIDAVFHSTSGGRTADSEDVWQSQVPYLRGVISEFEQHSPRLVSEKEMKISEFVDRVKKLDNTIQLDAKRLKDQVKVVERDDGGRIVIIKVGNKVFKGEKFRTAMGLSSANFKLEVNSSTISFSVIGNGHGIGLSQYGADGMGQQGFGYIDIVKHYYTEVEIINIYDFNLKAGY